jgi:outer membrane protein OmpA-like peptidoglycan-associated protein
MHTRRCPGYIAAIVLISSAPFPAVCLAQGDPNLPRDADGCTELKGLLKLAGSYIVSCDHSDSVEVVMPLKPDALGNSREKSVRGHYESREYQLLSIYQGDQAFNSLLQWLVLAGFKVKYFISPTTITARKDDTWLLVTVSGEYYDVKSVRVEEQPWVPVHDALGIAREMQTNQRARIYGIEFSPENQNVVEEHSKILGEVLAYLKANPGLTINVESHTTSNNDDAEGDLAITQKRAKAVAAWLEAHGVAPGCLRPEAVGRNKPLTENDTPIEIQKNDRIELVKIAP